MQNPLYPQQLENACPYCGSDDVSTDMKDFYPDVVDCSIKVDCSGCGKSHYVKFRPVELTLEDEKGESVVFNLGYMIPDMGKEGEADQGETLVCPGMFADGIFVMASGYGDGASPTGYGCPIIIEMCNNQLRAIVWDDVTHDDCGPIIDLEQSKVEHLEPGGKYKVDMKTPRDKVISSFDFDDLEAVKKYIEEKPIPIQHYVTVTEYETGKIVIDTRNKE